MKLRNKKTGEIGLMRYTSSDDGSIIIQNINAKDNCKYVARYYSLSELNEEWEDYEEPDELDEIISYITKGLEKEEIGVICNDVLEKLKACKRLKNKGAEFYGWLRNQTGTYELYLQWEDRIPKSYEVKKDLDLLFGGE